MARAGPIARLCDVLLLRALGGGEVGKPRAWYLDPDAQLGLLLGRCLSLLLRLLFGLGRCLLCSLGAVAQTQTTQQLTLRTPVQQWVRRCANQSQPER